MRFMKYAAALTLAAPLLLGASAFAQQGPLKIGLLSDFQSVYSDIGGAGNAEAAKMAIEEMGGTMFGQPIEFLSADVQNKPDIAASLARLATVWAASASSSSSRWYTSARSLAELSAT